MREAQIQLPAQVPARVWDPIKLPRELLVIIPPELLVLILQELLAIPQERLATPQELQELPALEPPEQRMQELTQARAQLTVVLAEVVPVETQEQVVQEVLKARRAPRAPVEIQVILQDLPPLQVLQQAVSREAHQPCQAQAIPA